MSHVVIFPTWACQLKCDYCSIRHSEIDRKVKPVPWMMWATSLPKALPRPSVIDVAGGEPLLYNGMVSLLESFAENGLQWALTTNAKSSEGIQAMCRRKPSGCVCINVSDHSGNPEAVHNVELLRGAGYKVNVHRVDHPSAGTAIKEAQVITYQDWSGGNAVDRVRRKCTAGYKHWVADPAGDLWRCVVALETGQPPVGNLFTGEIRPTKSDCDFGCSTCYTEDPGSWNITMEAI